VKGGEAQKQIESASKVAEEITGSHEFSNFLPIILYGRRIHRLEIKIPGRARVRFRGKNYMIIVERCGSELTEIISKYPAS
jgi:hypothetical protein